MDIKHTLRILIVDDQPEVVLVDLAMPGIDGFRMAQQTRQERLNEPLLIATSGLAGVSRPYIGVRQRQLDLTTCTQSLST